MTSAKIRYTLRLDIEIIEQLNKVAKKQTPCATTSGLIRFFIAQGLERYRKTGKIS